MDQKIATKKTNRKKCRKGDKENSNKEKFTKIYPNRATKKSKKRTKKVIKGRHKKWTQMANQRLKGI